MTDFFSDRFPQAENIKVQSHWLWLELHFQSDPQEGCDREAIK